MKKTKIVCTLGPASESEDVMSEMLMCGMNVARFNFSHGTHEYHKEVMDRFKRVREEAQRVDSVSGFFCRVPAGPWALAGKKGQAQEHCPDQYR